MSVDRLEMEERRARAERASQVVRAIEIAMRPFRFSRFRDEDELQSKLAQVLGQSRIWHMREFRLSDADRVDFMCSHGVVIEVKCDGTLTSLNRQLQRYAQHEAVTSLVLVTNRARLLSVPTQLSGKPITVISLLDGAL